MSIKSQKIFRDPVHDLIILDPGEEFILNLINTKEFQRLRRIKQLGLCHYVYPGAEHSRFTHSLGVFNFAKRMIEKLSARAEKKIERLFNDKVNIIKAASLLHDLGHGPFSHVFEGVFEEDKKSHEYWTCKIILDESTEVNRCLINERINPEEVAALVSDEAHWYFEIVKQPQDPFVSDIVSSQLDADRMDYLLRDSLMTGSRFGHYDSEWILNALTIAEVEDEGVKLFRLCLDASKGTGAIEGLLLARKWMTRYVYGHRANRAYEAEMICTMRLALACWMEHPQELEEQIPVVVLALLKENGQPDLKTYLKLDDAVIWWTIRQLAVAFGDGDPEILQSLSRYALGLVRRKKPWLCLEIDKNQLKWLDDELKRTYQERPLFRYACYLDSLDVLPYKNIEYKVPGGSGGAETRFSCEIHMVDKDGTVSRLSKQKAIEPFLDALTQKQSTARLFYDPEIEEEITGLMRKFGVC